MPGELASWELYWFGWALLGLSFVLIGVLLVNVGRRP
jgi:hypothetical protein